MIISASAIAIFSFIFIKIGTKGQPKEYFKEKLIFNFKINLLCFVIFWTLQFFDAPQLSSLLISIVLTILIYPTLRRQTIGIFKDAFSKNN